MTGPRQETEVLVSYVNPAKASTGTDPEALKAKYAPVFAHFYGIRPWEWDLLWWDEVLTLVATYERSNQNN